MLTRATYERDQIREVLLGQSAFETFGHEGQAGAGDALDVFSQAQAAAGIDACCDNL